MLSFYDLINIQWYTNINTSYNIIHSLNIFDNRKQLFKFKTNKGKSSINTHIYIARHVDKSYCEGFYKSKFITAESSSCYDSMNFASNGNMVACGSYGNDQ